MINGAFSERICLTCSVTAFSCKKMPMTEQCRGDKFIGRPRLRQLSLPNTLPGSPARAARLGTGTYGQRGPWAFCWVGRGYPAPLTGQHLCPGIPARLSQRRFFLFSYITPAEVTWYGNAHDERCFSARKPPQHRIYQPIKMWVLICNHVCVRGDKRFKWGNDKDVNILSQGFSVSNLIVFSFLKHLPAPFSHFSWAQLVTSIRVMSNHNVIHSRAYK